MEGAFFTGNRGGRLEGANTPENFQLRRACRCLMESSIGRRQSVFRMQQEPHGSCGSPRRSAGSWTGQTPWGAGSTRYGSPSRRGLKRVRGKRGRKPLRRSGKHVLRRGVHRPGTTAVEPGRRGSSAFRVRGAFDLVFLRIRGCRAPWTRERSRHRKVTTAQPSERTEGRVNPMSGCGPSVSARPEGEQTVEGVRNPEDGRSRVRQTRGLRSLRRCRCRGGKPQEGRPGQAWPGRASGPEP
jgi:hypothetical protein